MSIILLLLHHRINRIHITRWPDVLRLVSPSFRQCRRPPYLHFPSTFRLSHAAKLPGASIPHPAPNASGIRFTPPMLPFHRQNIFILAQIFSILIYTLHHSFGARSLPRAPASIHFILYSSSSLRIPVYPRFFRMRVRHHTGSQRATSSHTLPGYREAS